MNPGHVLKCLIFSPLFSRPLLPPCLFRHLPFFCLVLSGLLSSPVFSSPLFSRLLSALLSSPLFSSPLFSRHLSALLSSPVFSSPLFSRHLSCHLFCLAFSSLLFSSFLFSSPLRRSLLAPLSFPSTAPSRQDLVSTHGGRGEGEGRLLLARNDCGLAELGGNRAG